ncbi:hypothetical protein C8J57DRAFT_1476378 [Mycena rebaudengoi]|nr:hypothetical protein C8J57DRAFT_1476378 [Mycena rebaudengoi]
MAPLNEPDASWRTTSCCSWVGTGMTLTEDSGQASTRRLPHKASARTRRPCAPRAVGARKDVGGIPHEGRRSASARAAMSRRFNHVLLESPRDNRALPERRRDGLALPEPSRDGLALPELPKDDRALSKPLRDSLPLPESPCEEHEMTVRSSNRWTMNVCSQPSHDGSALPAPQRDLLSRRAMIVRSPSHDRITVLSPCRARCEPTRGMRCSFRREAREDVRRLPHEARSAGMERGRGGKGRDEGGSKLGEREARGRRREAQEEGRSGEACRKEGRTSGMDDDRTAPRTRRRLSTASSRTLIERLLQVVVRKAERATQEKRARDLREDSGDVRRAGEGEEAVAGVIRSEQEGGVYEEVLEGVHEDAEEGYGEGAAGGGETAWW